MSVKRRNPSRLLRSPKTSFDVFTDQPSEIVVGVVGPVGVDTDKVLHLVTQRLRAYQYESEVIRISRVIIPALAGPDQIPEKRGYEHARKLIELGNRIRRDSKNPAICATAAAAEIARRRPDPDNKVRRMAYIVSSLKNPEEVAELRKIYGAGFFLFAVHTDPEVRAEYLSKRGMTRSEAWDLISHDEHEEDEYGQHTRATFHLADFFLADERNEDKLRHSISRCLDLVFGCPYITPTFNEFAMFMAFAASLRSADLSRQVGAVISRNHEIVAMGANDCPAAGGGLYWPQFIGDRIDDAPRGRDYKRGFDSNLVERCKLISDIVDGLPTDIRPHVKDALSKSRIRDVTEYGRVVHAEMEALLSCARTSASTAGATLYCTTFPCHNCAKHIIAAGIDQVVYVEPYPKSKAVEFHDEAVTTGKVEGGEKRVRFKPFIGVGPRKFFELFSMNLSSGRPNVRKNDKDGTVVIWQESEASPRIPMLPVCHRDFENQALAYLRRLSRDRRTP